MACVVQVVGPSGSGKTRAIVGAVRELKSMGLRVAVLKHTHHDVDVPWKDSWRFLEEGGADASILVKGEGERVAVFTRMGLGEVLGLLRLSFDVVLVEGFSSKPLEADAVVDSRELGGSSDKLLKLVAEACNIPGLKS